MKSMNWLKIFVDVVVGDGERHEHVIGQTLAEPDSPERRKSTDSMNWVHLK